MSLTWNDTQSRSQRVRPGSYLVVIVVTDLAGNRIVKRLTVRVTR